MDLVPVIPFEPVRTETLPTGKQWIAQIKWDGVRMLTYYDGENVKLVNRRLNERTLQYPELADIQTYCDAGSVILDGEVIALDNGKPSFHEVMRRDRLKSAERVRFVQSSVPIVYMVFDVLFHNGAWVTERSLEERQAMLEGMIRPNEHVQLVPSFPDLPQLYDVVRQHQLEGIVCKDLTSTYVVNGKDKRWLKKKLIQDLIAVVGGVTYRGGIVNALLLGLYDHQGRLWYIGHAGTGKLKQEDWRAITEKTASMKVPDMPFANMPERSKGAVWIQPAMTAKIHFMEWTPHMTLRHPSIQALMDLPPKECKFTDHNGKENS